MTRRDTAELLLLGALWGGSFLFMRVAAPEFGPLALVWVRVLGAMLVLLPLLALRRQNAALRAHWKAIAAVGIVNSALPFLAFNIAALSLPAGVMAILNATSPMWALLVAWAWFKEAPAAARVAGVLLGVAGVIVLVGSERGMEAAGPGPTPTLGIALCLVATLLYGVGVNLARRHLGGVPPLAVATGSQAAAAALLALPAVGAWPAATPSAGAWGAALALAVACTALAYLLYFRLIANAGPTSAVSVTLLIPAFAMLWGALFLGERPGAAMWAGCALILLGTALSAGVIGWRRAPAA